MKPILLNSLTYFIGIIAIPVWLFSGWLIQEGGFQSPAFNKPGVESAFLANGNSQLELAITHYSTKQATSSCSVDAGGDQTVCPYEMVYLDAIVLSGTGSYMFEWDDGYGNIEYGQQVYIYPGSTTTYTLTMYDDSCTATDVVTIFADDSLAPVISTCPADIGPLAADPSSCDAIVSWGDPAFTDNCPGGTIYQISGSSSGSNFYPGSEIITYEAQDSSGLTASCSFTITVDPADPLAAFSYSVTDSMVYFFDASSNADTWSWDFGDGNFDSQSDPAHVYSGQGTYIVCLTVDNFCGTNMVCDTVVVGCVGCGADAGILIIGE